MNTGCIEANIFRYTPKSEKVNPVHTREVQTSGSQEEHLKRVCSSLALGGR